jgi:hypothetical protein
LSIAAAAGCSSSQASGGGDAGDGGSEQDVVLIIPDGAGVEAAPAQVCDASLLLTGDSGAAVCAACQAKSCASQMAECSADCLCAMAVDCLQQNDNNYPSCPGAIAGLSDGNKALTDLGGCTAMKCSNTPCFPGSATDSGKD